MEKLEIFKNDIFGEIRRLEINEKDYFQAVQCASILGYSNPRSALKRHAKYAFKHKAKTSGGVQEAIFIPESDLFRLIVHSKLPYAKKFERWVFDEVLPTIRSKGIYATDKVIEEGLKDSTTIKGILTELKEEREQLMFELEESKEKVNYHDKVLNSKLLMPITIIAKDYGMSGSQMNKILNSLRVQYKISDKWVLYQEYAPQGYTSSKTLNISEGKYIIVTYWTEKGRVFIYELLKEKLVVVPLIEK